MEQRPLEYTVKIYCEGFTEWYYFEWLRTIHLTPAEYRREINGTAKCWLKLQRYSMILQTYRTWSSGKVSNFASSKE